MPAWGKCRASRIGRLDREDAEVDAAEGVETRARPRACGDASEDAEDAAAGEGKATLTRTRLGAAARPADADDGEAIAGVDAVRESLRAGGLSQLQCFPCSSLLERHSNGRL